MSSALWNPWHGCHKLSEGCRNCYVYRIDSRHEKDASEVIAACRERGVLVIKAKNKVRLLPPLNIPFELLKKAVTIIKEAAKECVQ